MPDSNLEVWLTTYTEQLHTLYGNNPQWFAELRPRWPRLTIQETLRAFAENTTEGLSNGRWHKETNAITHTCQHLGIEHSYTAIQSFITASPVTVLSSHPPRSMDCARAGIVDPGWARFVAEIGRALGKPIPLSGMNRPIIRGVLSFAEDRYTVTLPYSEPDEHQRFVRLHGYRSQEFLTHDDATGFAIECWARGQVGVYLTTPRAAVAYNASLTRL
jgi:hypothetical protein